MWRQSANHSLSLRWAEKTAPWEFQIKLLHYFFMSNNTSNLHAFIYDNAINFVNNLGRSWAHNRSTHLREGSAHLILRNLLRGQTLRGLMLQKKPSNNPTTLEEPHKDGQSSTLLRKEIWPQGREKPDASNVHFESHFVSHSPVAKSPYWAEFVFMSWHLSILAGFFVSSSVAGFFAGFFCGVKPRKVWPSKRKWRRAGPLVCLFVGFDIIKHENPYFASRPASE